MAKKTLVFSMTTAAGAGTYAAPLISEGGAVKNQAGWVAPKAWGIAKVLISGAAGSFITIQRNSHTADNIVLQQLADTIVDLKKTINIAKILGAAGKPTAVEVLQGETIAITATVTGNSTISITLEMDDSLPVVNCRAVRVAGANAAVALTPTETGANIIVGLNPNANYKVRGCYLWSTTAQDYQMQLGNQSIALPAQNAILTGFGYTKLDDQQADVMAGSGATFASSFSLWAKCVAADAAAIATQCYSVIFSSS